MTESAPGDIDGGPPQATLMTGATPSGVDGGLPRVIETKYVDDRGCSEECYLKVCSHICMTESVL